MNQPKSHFPQIDALRAVAALGVFFFHLYTGVFLHAELQPRMMLADLRAHGGFWRWAAAPSLFGYAGVPVFFVISGFCIHHAFLNSSRSFSYIRFMSRRFWRIYPAYVVAITLSLMLPGNEIYKAHHLPKSLLLHLLFLHNFNKTTIFELSAPFWTLAVEFQFYAVFPLFLWLREKLGVRFAALVSLAICTLVSVASHHGWLGHANLFFAPSMLWVQWCLGAFIAEQFHDGKPPAINFPVAICLWMIGILFAVPIAAYSEWNYLAWAILTAGTIERWIRNHPASTGNGSTEPPARISLPFACLIWLGTISYSVYLLHAIALGQLLPRLPGSPERRFGLSLVVIFPTVIAASAACYYLVEAPGIAFGRKMIARYFR